jgi:hypothetical protein
VKLAQEKRRKRTPVRNLCFSSWGYCCTINPSTNYSVSPTHAYRFELHNSDSEVEGGKRAELEGAPEPPLQERIYDFCIYLPNGGAEDFVILSIPQNEH